MDRPACRRPALSALISLAAVGPATVVGTVGTTATRAQQPADASDDARALDVAGPPAHRVPYAAGPAAAWADDFDRPNATRMGPDWTEYIGDQVLLNNHGQGNLANNFGYMLHNTASLRPAAAMMQVDLLPPSGSGGPHVALIAGARPGSYQWFYTKIQDGTNDGTYDRIYFYSVSNGTAWGSTRFRDLSRPIATGRVYMYFTNGGDTLNVDIDADFDGTIDQHVSNSGALAVPVAGTMFGIGTWAMGSYDNWRVVDCAAAAWRTYGIGFPGTNGAPGIAASRNPGLGTLVTVAFGNSLGASAGGAVLVGGAATAIPGFWGGTILVAPDVLLPAIVPPAGMALPLQIPRDPFLCGHSVFLQGLVLDPGAARGIANTQGLELAVGF